MKQHATIDDCWVIVNNIVHDVSGFISKHPGGVNAIKKHCGGDGTTSFEGVDHPTYARKKLATFRLGKLIEEV